MSQFNSRPSFRLPKRPPPQGPRSPTRRPPQTGRNAPIQGRRVQAEDGRNGLGSASRAVTDRRYQWQHNLDEGGARILASESQEDHAREISRHEAQSREASDQDVSKYRAAREARSDQTSHPDDEPEERQEKQSSNHVKRRRLDSPSLSSRLQDASPAAIHQNRRSHTPTAPHSRAPARPTPVSNTASSRRTNAEPSFNTPRPFSSIFATTSATIVANANQDAERPDSAAPPASTTASRPRFIVPSASSSTHSDDHSHTIPNFTTLAPPPPLNPSFPPPSALPDIFSPHKKKHERYLQGGWAAQVRNWVLDISTASAAGANVPEAFGAFTVPRRRDGLVGCEVVVESAEVASAGGGVRVVGMLVGRRVDGGSVGVVVVGEGGGGGGQGGLGGGDRERRDEDVKAGDRIVLGLPAWKVEVGVNSEVGEGSALSGTGRKWTICPVWRRG